MLARGEPDRLSRMSPPTGLMGCGALKSLRYFVNMAFIASRRELERNWIGANGTNRNLAS